VGRAEPTRQRVFSCANPLTPSFHGPLRYPMPKYSTLTEEETTAIIYLPANGAQAEQRAAVRRSAGS
jgi:hypothetical protein